MRTLKLAFSALVFTALASGASAQAAHPCKEQHLAAKSACASDKHSPDCKAARKAVKDCRVANGLPVKGNKTTAAGAPGSVVTSPSSPAPAAPQSATPPADMPSGAITTSPPSATAPDAGQNSTPPATSPSSQR